MKICIDDGSTNIKLAWTENGERRNAISPNSFKSEWSAPFGGTQPANYMLDGVRYGFDPVSDRFVQTTDTQYQYSDVNVIAIHHALVKSGITPQEVDVVVTLPLSEYFDTNAQPDMANINRKKANVMRPVEYQNGETFTIRNVRVMPESIPAGFKALADMSPFESLLIVDLGGTTLDVAKVQGQLAGISQVFCDPHVGVSLMADAVLSVMATNGMRTSHHIANTIIEHRHDEAWLRQHIHNDTHYASLMAVIREKEETLKQRVIRALAGFSGYGRVMVVGGGAEIVAPLSAKPAELMRLSSRTGCHNLLWLMGCTQWTRSKSMTTPTRRISFYLKPAVVKSEREACSYLDSLPASERSRAQRAAFLAGLALIKRTPALAYSLAEWSEDEIRMPPLPVQPEKPAQPAADSAPICSR